MSRPGARPRGTCAICGGEWALRSDGTLHRHHNHAIGASEETQWRVPVCDGSHCKPESLLALRDLTISEMQRVYSAALLDERAKLRRVEALIQRWESEAQDRGPGDTLFTSGVASMLRAALEGIEQQVAPERPTGSIAGWVQCPDCGLAVPLGLAPLRLTTDEDGQQIASADIQMDDVWAHAWTHEATRGES